MRKPLPLRSEGVLRSHETTKVDVATQECTSQTRTLWCVRRPYRPISVASPKGVRACGFGGREGDAIGVKGLEEGTRNGKRWKFGPLKKHFVSMEVLLNLF